MGPFQRTLPMTKLSALEPKPAYRIVLILTPRTAIHKMGLGLFVNCDFLTPDKRSLLNESVLCCLFIHWGACCTYISLILDHLIQAVNWWYISCSKGVINADGQVVMTSSFFFNDVWRHCHVKKNDEGSSSFIWDKI